MDGIIVINKEKGCTSHDVVYKIKKIFGKKVGHTGTLDPNATGVLPILIGKGTELSQFLINHDKKYIATIQLGAKTDTADVEGKIIEEKPVDSNALNDENVGSVLKSLVGKQQQVPPMYSAIKVNGKKLYEYARSGKTVEIASREIEIYELKLLNINENMKTITYEIHCSKGTYVRTVCENIAERLGTVGYMLDLQRTMVGDFKLEDAITVEELEKNFSDKEFVSTKLTSVEDFFANKDEVSLNTNKMSLFLNGVMLDVQCCRDNYVRVYDENKRFVGIGQVLEGKLKRKIVLKKGTVL